MYSAKEHYLFFEYNAKLFLACTAVSIDFKSYVLAMICKTKQKHFSHARNKKSLSYNQAIALLFMTLQLYND